MKNSSTVLLDKHSAVSNLPQGVGSVTSKEAAPNPKIKVVFVDEIWLASEPSLDYYRKLYQDAGYSDEMIDSLIEGLSRSSLYEGKTS